MEAETLVEALACHAMRQPKKPYAIVHAGGSIRQLTYGELSRQSAAFAARLQGAGIQPGDVVAVFLPTGIGMFAPYFGAMLLGAVPTYMPLPSGKQDATYYWQSHEALFARLRPKAIVVDPGTARQISGLPFVRDIQIFDTGQIVETGPGKPDAVSLDLGLPTINPAGIALLQHSSGTTGLKKGVMLSHSAVLAQVRSYAGSTGANVEDVVVSWLPLYHDMGLIACTVSPLVLGQTIVLLDPFEWVGQPHTLLLAIERHRGTLIWLPNFAFDHLVRTARPGPVPDLSSVRAFINCSEPCQPSTFSRFLDRFGPGGITPNHLQVCYAMAETTFAVTQTRPGQPARRQRFDADALRLERKALVADAGETVEMLSCGTPIDGVSILIRDEDGRVLPAGRVGEVAIIAPFLFDGYFALPDLTAERLSGGVYATRDLGFQHEDEVFIIGRVDDVIIVHGKNLFAHEVEAIVNRIPGLKPGRVVAFGIQNDIVGSTDLVVVAERDQDSAYDADLRRRMKLAVSTELAVMVQDTQVVDPGWLIKTTSGKISREMNRKKFMKSG